MPPSFETLSPVQQQVLSLLASGTTAQAAAESAGVHRDTVSNWRRSESPALQDEARENVQDEPVHNSAQSCTMDEPAVVCLPPESMHNSAQSAQSAAAVGGIVGASPEEPDL